MHKLTIVIPCLNEAATILRAIKEAKKASIKLNIKKVEIIVADNGSSDGTLKILKKQRVAKVINVPIKGYGAALHFGILKAKGDYVLFADADLSYPFTELPKFIPYLKNSSDLVLGSRMKGKIDKGAMPFLNRYLGTPVLTAMIRWLYKIPTTDSNSGMRLIRKDFYKKLHMRNSGMEWASELLIKTAIYKGRYFEVPIHFKKDQRSKKPHLLRWVDGWKHFKAIILLKPESLAFPIIIFLILSTKSLYFLIFAFILGLSSLTAKILNATISSQSNSTTKYILHLPLVLIAAAFTLISFILPFINSVPINTALLIVSLSAIIDMWVFLIETIKTHLINVLPENI